MEYSIIVFEDGECGYIARCEEMPTVSTFGDTEAEAIEEFKIAMSLAEEIMEEQGTPMPDLPVEFTLDTIAAMSEEPIKTDSVDDFFDAL